MTVFATEQPFAGIKGEFAWKEPEYFCGVFGSFSLATPFLQGSAGSEGEIFDFYYVIALVVIDGSWAAEEEVVRSA